MKKYWPLFALILVAILAAFALAYRGGHWMTFFMGFFLSQFALLKLFHPVDFAESFKMYDLIAKKFSLYAWIYPLIELALGLAYLSGIWPVPTYLLTIIVMGVGAVGVIQALRQSLDLRCACMGTVLDVPLSTVTLTEDLLMGLMALWMMFHQ